MGWDNTTELIAAVVDAVKVQTRTIHNALYEPDRTPVERVPRPYEAKPEPKAVTLAALGDLLKEG